MVQEGTKQEESEAEEEEEGGLDAEIRNLWTNVDKEATAFAGKAAVLRELRRRHPDIPFKHLKSRADLVMSREPGYVIHAPRRKRFLTSFYNSPEYYRLLDVDLADMKSLAKYNQGVSYLMVAVESSSRRIFVETLKNKTAEEVLNAFKRLFKQLPHKIKVLRHDSGTEFRCKLVRDYMTKQKIVQKFASNQSKASLSERAIYKITKPIGRYLTFMNSSTYLPVLQKIVHNVNSLPHSTTKIAANEFKPERDLYPAWERSVLAHWPAIAKARKNKIFKFELGDMVRISREHDPLVKGFLGQWTPEYFFVTDRLPGPPKTYKLKDVTGEPISAWFNEKELIASRDLPSQAYPVDKIIRKRKGPVEQEALVTFKGWPSKHQVWLPVSAIKSTSESD